MVKEYDETNTICKTLATLSYHLYLVAIFSITLYYCQLRALFQINEHHDVKLIKYTVIEYFIHMELFCD